MNERMKFNPVEAERLGAQDARALLFGLANPSDAKPAKIVQDSLCNIINLASDHRLEECAARLQGFCEIIGPVLAEATDSINPEITAITEYAIRNRTSLEQTKARLEIISLRCTEDASIPEITETEGGEL